MLTRYTLRGPNGLFWSLGAASDGTIEQITIDNAQLRDFDDMVVKELRGPCWKFTASEDGNINYTTTDAVLDANRAIDYIPFVTDDGVFMKMRVIAGIIRMFETEDLLSESIPTPSNVVLSHESGSNRLIHSSCGLPTITPRGDFGLWCGSCNVFVLPENSNFLVVLEE